MARGPLCLRLTEDLHAAVHQLAEQQGVSSSEWLRDLIFRAVYSEPLGMDEGYLHGRSLGYAVLQNALADLKLPETADEAMLALQARKSPGRTPHQR